MMGEAAETNPTTLQPLTEDHRKLIFSFIRVLREVDSPNPERASAIIQLLGEEYSVDPAGVGGSHDAEVDLLKVFRQALQSHKSEENEQQKEKFKAFLELIEKKGYFAGAEPGTEEYASRLEKAKQKFELRNNPYQGKSAEEIKNKGNELMGMSKYKEAIAYYTKAIEMEPKNHVFFANRAAAHTHLKDYNSAIIDCEHAIALSPDYSKAYSRLGTALFYQEKYVRAVDAFSRACELDPANDRYKEDLKQAEEKVKMVGSATTGGASAGGFPFAGGMPDFTQISQMMNNPQFLEATTRMMQNPQFSQMVANMASSLGGGAANPAELLQSLGSMTRNEMNSDGLLQTPFGNIDRESLERLQQEEVQNNPKFRAIMDDVRQNGFAAFQKYIGDPDVMDLMIRFQNTVMNSGNANSSPQ
ncbi:putative small glutamine-rich tetratricopeptide repeat protein [Trypanosoma conorhini]|uniref:Putative small glutamine-rich tetratricopeptide repeat protein n=1 Tax=Trypanosoma conorhini TaxID=83891 RepID=A0A3R7KYT7_9TRYP|nr:putative small glutamine-rich tetratricopeptide repeat protein [Trypanosoma conorhini]RNF17791.1 putative small glutamine-rich tetratricopeptide repeat protein [Trypanosoma conorhini]